MRDAIILLQPTLIASGIIFLVLAYSLWRRADGTSSLRRRVRLVLSIALAVLGLGLLGTGATLFWTMHRPRPKPVERILFEGIRYVREVRDTPRPLIVHTLVVDMTTPGIEFLVTPADPPRNGTLPARTTARFLKEFNVQAAVNGDCFADCHTESVFDYYPKPGDPVHVLGNAASEGKTYATSHRIDLTLFISKANEARIGRAEGDVYNAISGTHRILRHGVVTDDLPETIHPRTAAALDHDRKTLILMVIDGRQPRYSEGVTLQELARLLQDHGAYNAINLDGGGSSSLVVEKKPGKTMRLNCPVHTGIPGRERPVANHLGIRARRP